MAGFCRLLMIMVCGLFHVALGSSSPRRISGRRKLRDPVPRPEFSEYELSEYSQSEPPLRRHYHAVMSESEDESPSRVFRGTSAPIAIKGKNKHPLFAYDFASDKLQRRRPDAIHNAFKHHHKRRPTTSSSEYWSEYKRAESGVLLPERKVATVRGPTPPRRLRAMRPAVTYQVYLTPSESSSSTSGDEYQRRGCSSIESSDDDYNRRRRLSTDVDLIFELSIDQMK